MANKSDEEKLKYHRDYNRRYYAENKEKEKARLRIRRDELTTWYKQYKKTLSCRLCYENHPACLEFHHENPQTKSEEISFMYKCSKTRFLNELKKCIILCANCHRKLHYTEDKNSKLYKRTRIKTDCKAL